MKSATRFSGLIALSLVASAGALAHHNTGAVFDLEQEVTIKGTVTRYHYRNPHIYFFILDEQGTEWRVEAGPTALMNRIGWSAGTMKEGDRIEMTGNPSRRAGKASAFLKSATVGGDPLPMFRSEDTFKTLTEDNSERDIATDSLEGTWVTLLTQDSGWVDNPEALPLNDAGRASIDSFDENTMSPALTCTPMTAPAMMMIPDTKRIEITDDSVRISSEFNGATRIVHLTEVTATDSSSTQGYSTGRIDDHSLRVETSGFEAHRMGIAYGLASSASKRLVEEFTLAEDGKGLTYRFTLTDPEFLEEAFEAETYWAYRPDQPFETLPCDLENSRLFLDE